MWRRAGRSQSALLRLGQVPDESLRTAVLDLGHHLFGLRQRVRASPASVGSPGCTALMLRMPTARIAPIEEAEPPTDRLADVREERRSERNAAARGSEPPTAADRQRHSAADRAPGSARRSQS